MRSAEGDGAVGNMETLAAGTRRASPVFDRPIAGGGLRAALARHAAALASWFGDQLAVEAAARTAFYLLPAGIMAGIGLVYGLGWRWPLLPVSLAAAGLLAAGVLLSGRRASASVCLTAGFVLCGMALSGTELQRTRTTTFSGEVTVRIDGVVLWRDTDERGRTRYLVQVERTERPVLSRPPGRAQILVASRHQAIAIGGRFKGLVRLRPPSGPAYPGGYDFAFGTYFKGLGAYGYGLGPPDPQPASVEASRSLAQRLVMLRLAISDRIRSTIGGAEGAVASALVTGERSGIPDEIDLWLRTTGLSHVLSISGFHMALIAGFSMTLIRALLAAIPALTLVLPAKKIAAAAAIAVASFYLALSGNDVAAERSYIMLSIMLLAVLFDRPALTLRNVAISALVVLAVSPHALMTASFQMSFAATAALVAAYGGYARWRSGRLADASARRPKGVLLTTLFFLGGLGVSSLIAGAATGPYAAFHFQRIAPFGLIANMVALPLFSLWIMPLALIGMLLMPLGLDEIPFLLLGHGLTAVFRIAHVLHDRLPDSPTGLMTPESLLVLTVALLLGCFMASKLRWLAVPVAVVGLILAPDRAAMPELLIFEDGKEVAMIDAGGALVPLRKRTNDFVASQWQRAFVGVPDASRDAGGKPPVAFTCEATQGAAEPGKSADGLPVPDGGKPPEPADAHPFARGNGKAAPPGGENAKPPGKLCRGTTRSGLRVVWTDDYRKAGLACDEADVAIVARALKLEACRSGALLVTLKTLRRSGSLAVSRSPELPRKPVAVASISEDLAEWNRHRDAPWPQSWRRPAERPAEATRSKADPSDLAPRNGETPAPSAEQRE